MNLRELVKIVTNSAGLYAEARVAEVVVDIAGDLYPVQSAHLQPVAGDHSRLRLVLRAS
jgi:hypothetical protein